MAEGREDAPALEHYQALLSQSWGGPGRVTEPGFSLLLEEKKEFSSSAAHGWIF